MGNQKSRPAKSKCLHASFNTRSSCHCSNATHVAFELLPGAVSSQHCGIFWSRQFPRARLAATAFAAAPPLVCLGALIQFEPSWICSGKTQDSCGKEGPL